jgi:hypothetical protein
MKQCLIIFALFSVMFLIKPAQAVTSLVDTDKDGLIDEQELQFKTDINNPDTDGDGFVDGLEIAKGFDPLSKESRKLTKNILIDLKKQELYQQLNGITIRTHTVSTGKPSMPTPKGTFSIANKALRAWSRQYGLWMPYWMGIKGTRAGIHELPEWPNGYKEGANHLGKPVSHGCIRLDIKAAEIVYNWTEIGTKVIIK